MVPEPELDKKLCIWFPSLNIFFIHSKVKKTSNFFLEKFAFYGLDMELETEPEP